MSCDNQALVTQKRSVKMARLDKGFMNCSHLHGDNLVVKSQVLKPLLRWAGGKQWLSSRLAPLILEGIGTYYEPFLGGGSLYFASLPFDAVLSDLNPRLVETYETLRDEPRDIISILGEWPNEKDTYYKVRDSNFLDCTLRVAQFIYLNRTCWNGLYRVNRQGNFNVPFGNHKRVVFDADHLLEISQALKDAELRCSDFEKALAGAKKGDFVYLDPPYTAHHEQNGFRQYNDILFSWKDQQRLGDLAVTLAEKGCTVIVSNANHDSIIKLYPGFGHIELSRHSVIAASSKHRRVTTELLMASDVRLLHEINASDGREYNGR